MRQWRLSWEMWPKEWKAPHRTEKVHSDEAEMRNQLAGLKAMEADHAPRPCDQHVWNIKVEECEMGEWFPAEGGDPRGEAPRSSGGAMSTEPEDMAAEINRLGAEVESWRILATRANEERDRLRAADALSKAWVERGSPPELLAYLQSVINEREAALAAADREVERLFEKWAAAEARARGLEERVRRRCFYCQGLNDTYEQQPRSWDTSEGREWRHWAKAPGAMDSWEVCELSPEDHEALRGGASG